MGLDAESTDLTARIRRRRAELVAQGEVDPARPGEHRQFRGGNVAPSPPRRDIPTRGAHRVVPVDESPERGGADALVEPAKTSAVGDGGSDGTAEEVATLAPTGPPATAVNVNEFGEEYDHNDDGGFDLDDVRPIAAMTPVTGEELDAAGGPSVTIEEVAEIQSRPEAQVKRKRTGPKRTTQAAIDQLGDRLANDLGYVLRDVVNLQAAVTALDERLSGIEEAMLLMAKSVANPPVVAEAPPASPLAPPAFVSEVQSYDPKDVWAIITSQWMEDDTTEPEDGDDRSWLRRLLFR